MPKPQPLRPVNPPLKKGMETGTVTKWKWKLRLHTSAKVREAMTWLFNEYKRSFILFDEQGREQGIKPLTPEDVRTMGGLLTRINDVLKDAITEGQIREMEDMLKRLTDGKKLTPAETAALLGNRKNEDALRDEPLDDPDEAEDN